MSNGQWYYSRGSGDLQGPVDASELARLAQAGELRADDHVWKESMEEWVPASRIKGLPFAAAPQLRPTPLPKVDRNVMPGKGALLNAQQKADEVAGALWFLDLKFKRLISASIIRGVWMAYVIIVVLGLVLGLVGSILEYPILHALRNFVGLLFICAISTLFFRLFLEAFLVIFRISEDLREIKNCAAVFHSEKAGAPLPANSRHAGDAHVSVGGQR